jgi:hypothetical protein
LRHLSEIFFELNLPPNNPKSHHFWTLIYACPKCGTSVGFQRQDHPQKWELLPLDQLGLLTSPCSQIQTIITGIDTYSPYTPHPKARHRHTNPRTLSIYDLILVTMNLRYLQPPHHDPTPAGDTTAPLVSSETPYSRRGYTRGPTNSAASPIISPAPRQQAQMDVPRVVYIPLRFAALPGTRSLWCLWRGTGDAVIFGLTEPRYTIRAPSLWMSISQASGVFDVRTCVRKSQVS